MWLKYWNCLVYIHEYYRNVYIVIVLRINFEPVLLGIRYVPYVPIEFAVSK